MGSVVSLTKNSCAGDHALVHLDAWHGRHLKGEQEGPREVLKVPARDRPGPDHVDHVVASGVVLALVPDHELRVA